MATESDELLSEPEDLDAAGGHLHERPVGSVEQQPLRPQPDPDQGVAEPRPNDRLDLVREVGIEDVDVDADQRPGPEADAMAGELPDPGFDGRHIDRDRRPTRERRPLLARHDRDRGVAVVEEPQPGIAEADCGNADAAAEGHLRVLLSVGGAGLSRRRHGLLRGPETHPLEGEHVLQPVADAAVEPEPGRPLPLVAPAVERALAHPPSLGELSLGEMALQIGGGHAASSSSGSSPAARSGLAFARATRGRGRLIARYPKSLGP